MTQRFPDSCLAAASWPNKYCLTTDTALMVENAELGEYELIIEKEGFETWEENFTFEGVAVGFNLTKIG